MKTSKLLLIGAISLVASVPCTRSEITPAQEFRISLAAVRTPEVPKEVARLIGQLKGSDREANAVEIVRSAVQLNPASATAIVGSAARVAPDLSPKLSAAAAALEPRLAAGI